MFNRPATPSRGKGLATLDDSPRVGVTRVESDSCARRTAAARLARRCDSQWIECGTGGYFTPGNEQDRFVSRLFRMFDAWLQDLIGAMEQLRLGAARGGGLRAFLAVALARFTRCMVMA